jgi:alcohol dehydrogenase class IV
MKIQSDNFEFHLPVSLYFGVESLQMLPQICKQYGTNILLVTSIDLKEIEKQIISILEQSNFVIDEFYLNSPEPTCLFIDLSAKKLAAKNYDCIIGLGGGSAMDMAKSLSIALTNPEQIWAYANLSYRPPIPILNQTIPVISIPTTSGGGSESTPYAVITNSQTKMKKGMRSEKLYPKLVIIDTELLCLMPQQLVAISGFDAFTQALESFTSKNSNIVSDYFALKSLELIISNLEKSWESPENIVSREKMALGSLLSGFAIGITDTNLAHAMSHPISAHYGIQHGLAVFLCTFQEIQFNKVVAAEKYARVASLFNHDEHNKKTQTLIDNLHKWVQKFDIKLNFKNYNIPKSAIEKFVLDAIEIGGIQTNPRPVDIKQLEQLYEKSWNGVVD